MCFLFAIFQHTFKAVFLYAVLLYTHACTVTWFCRCFAFQIGKICYQKCIVRNFQFRKFLPVYSNYAVTVPPCANSNWFCRYFAFQIGKIYCHHCIVRNFQFRKFLPVHIDRYQTVTINIVLCNLVSFVVLPYNIYVVQPIPGSGRRWALCSFYFHFLSPVRLV